MFAIIVGTHGKFSEELVKTCEMICGATKNVQAVTLVPGEGPDDVVKKYEDAMANSDLAPFEKELIRLIVEKEKKVEK